MLRRFHLRTDTYSVAGCGTNLRLTKTPLFYSNPPCWLFGGRVMRLISFLYAVVREVDFRRGQATLRGPLLGLWALS